MNRAACDNALLASCEGVYDRIIDAAKVMAMVGTTALAIGGVWFLCVAVPAGALWK